MATKTTNRTTKTVTHPNALWHFRVSIGKSILRILAGLSLATGDLFIAGALLIIAEVGGIIEEMV
jgi:hypothetical protein